jgi:hypothetical protein
MKIQKFVTLGLCAAATGLGLTFSSGGIAAPARNSPPQPFSASIDITEQVTLIGAPCPLIAAVSGSGTATHLGRASVVSNDCIIPQVGEPVQFFSPAVVLTAANGDQMFASYGGVVVPTTGAISGTFTIHGGTGRFVSAWGNGQLAGSEDTSPLLQLSPMSPGPVTLRGHITLSGTVSYE